MVHTISRDSHSHADDEKLRRPHICIIIQQNLESAASYRLLEEIPQNCQQGRQDCLLLSVHDREQQNIEQEEIQPFKVPASRRLAAQQAKEHTADHIFHKRECAFDCCAQARFASGSRLLRINVGGPAVLHKANNLPDLFSVIRDCTEAELLGKPASVQHPPLIPAGLPLQYINGEPRLLGDHPRKLQLTDLFHRRELIIAVFMVLGRHHGIDERRRIFYMQHGERIPGGGGNRSGLQRLQALAETNAALFLSLPGHSVKMVEP